MRVLAVLFLLLPLAAAAQVKVTYLANAGVLLTSPKAKVLVDSLFRDSLDDYMRHSAAVQEQMESGQAPFDGVVLALATHFHLDHWDAGAVSRFLKSNPNAAFGSTPQGVAMIPSRLSSRALGLSSNGGAPAVLEAPEVRVEASPLEHGKAANLGLRIFIGDRVIVHVGDAEPSAANLNRMMSEGPPPDIAVVPFWWLLDGNGQAFLAKRWKPRQVIAVHFGAADAAKYAARVSEMLPGVWVCVQPGESRSY